MILYRILGTEALIAILSIIDVVDNKKCCFMENIAVNRLMRLINSLSIELKLELLSRLSENVRKGFTSDTEKDSREKKLEELFGAWRSTDDELAKNIIQSRTSSDREISFD